jgi:hypothetical protein
MIYINLESSLFGGPFQTKMNIDVIKFKWFDMQFHHLINLVVSILRIFFLICV